LGEQQRNAPDRHLQAIEILENIGH
jgi:hypothetical protein